MNVFNFFSSPIGLGHVTRDIAISEKFENVLKSKKRKNCAPPAPACGLYLEKVIY